jgi:hypothetical protein
MVERGENVNPVEIKRRGEYDSKQIVTKHINKKLLFIFFSYNTYLLRRVVDPRFRFLPPRMTARRLLPPDCII